MIQIKEFDFKTRQNKEDNVNEKLTQKETVTESNKEQCKNSDVVNCEQVSFAPDAAWTKRTRVWNSDINWFNDGYMSTIDNQIDRKMSNENVMQKQECLVAEAYAKLLTAKREYLQAKKGLHSLYDNFNVSELREE